MTNYPRDEFDRVPEFSNRSGSHRENGWAAAASVGGARSGLRWLMVFGALALVVGLFSFMVLPKFMGTSNEPAPVAASSSGSEQATEIPSGDTSETPSESATESDSAEATDTAEPTDESPSTEPGESDFPEDVDPTMAMGVYNGASTGGIAGTARTTLLNAGYTNVKASDWTKKVTYSTVYYRSEPYRATAEAAAKELGLTSIMQSADIPGNIAIVLGNTYQ